MSSSVYFLVASKEKCHCPCPWCGPVLQGVVVERDVEKDNEEEIREFHLIPSHGVFVLQQHRYEQCSSPMGMWMGITASDYNAARLQNVARFTTKTAIGLGTKPMSSC